MNLINYKILKDINLKNIITFISILFIIIYFLYHNSYILFNGLDGTWIKMLINKQLNNPITLTLSLDPLSGLGNFTAIINSSLNFSYQIQNLIFGEVNKFFSSLFFSFELFISSLICSKIFKFKRATGIISGLISIILIFPIFWPHRFYPIFSLLPHLAESLLLINLCLYILIINKNSLIKLVIWIIIFNLSLLIFIASNPLFSVIFFPYFIITTCYIYYSNNSNKLHTFIILFSSVIFNLINGSIFFLIGIATHSVPFFFKSELFRGQMSTYNISILFHEDFGSIIFISTVLYLIIGLFSHKQAYQNLKYYILSVCSFILCVGYILSNSNTYSGPSMLYFEVPFYIFFILCFTKIISDLSLVIFSKINEVSLKFFDKISIIQINIALLIFLFILILYFLIIYKRPLTYSTSFSNPSTNDLINIVKNEISLGENNTFRGRLATFTGTQDLNSVNWSNLHSFDYHLFNISKTDFRFIGPWSEQIPTLQEYGQTISPSSYFLFSRSLSRPQDKQIRNIILFTNPNLNILALYGVKYMFTDRLIDNLIPLNIRHYEKIKIYLYEIGNPNIGSYSPVTYEVINDANILVNNLLNKNFDFSKIVYLPKKLEFNLVPASNTIIRFTPLYNIQVSSKNIGTFIDCFTT